MSDPNIRFFRLFQIRIIYLKFIASTCKRNALPFQLTKSCKLTVDQDFLDDDLDLYTVRINFDEFNIHTLINFVYLKIPEINLTHLLA